MTNHKDHLKETEYNLSQTLSNSRLNSEAVIADVLDVSFGSVVLTINGVPGNHFFTRHVIVDGSGVGVFTIIIDASGRNIASGNTMHVDLTNGILATSIFVHDLWNRLWFGTAYDGNTNFTILGGVGAHDIQTLRIEGSFSTDPFLNKLEKVKVKEIGVHDHATIPCPSCGKLCIERHIMNLSHGYCSLHGKFRFAGTRFTSKVEELEYSKFRSLLQSTHRGFRTCEAEAIESYNQWLSLEPGILKDSFIFNKVGLEYFFNITEDSESDQEILISKNPSDDSVLKAIENEKIDTFNYTKNYIKTNDLTIKELFSWCKFGYCEIRTWDQIVLSGLLFNRI